MAEDSKCRRFSCYDCGLTFTSSSNQNAHIKKLKHVRKGSFCCDFCGEGFFGLRLLTNHVQAKLVECCICKKVFCNSVILQKHMNFHTTMLHQAMVRKEFDNKVSNKLKSGQPRILMRKVSNPPTIPHYYKCQQCDKIYQTMEKLQLHMAMVKADCRICNLKFCSLQAMHKHLAVHTGTIGNGVLDKKAEVASQPQCHLCKEIFLSQVDLKKHMNIVKINCQVCGLLCCSLNAMIEHSKTHTNATNGSYTALPQDISLIVPQCGQCKEVFLNVDHLKKHADIVKVNCQICGLSCCSLSVMQNHVANEHAQNSVAQPQCHICRETFSSNKDLIEHTQITKFSCHICKIICCSQGAMKEHHLNEHVTDTIEREVIQCSQCREIFRCQRDLQRHAKSNKIDCHICGLVCCSRVFMRKHLVEHTGIPYGNDAISQSQNVTPDSVKCSDQCQEGFQNVQELAKHKSVANCPVCDLKCCNQSSLMKHVAKHRARVNRPPKPAGNTVSYWCDDQCGHTFSDKYQLKMHKSYVKVDCRVCGLKCCTFRSLSKHMKEEHRNKS